MNSMLCSGQPVLTNYGDSKKLLEEYLQKLTAKSKSCFAVLSVMVSSTNSKQTSLERAGRFQRTVG